MTGGIRRGDGLIQDSVCGGKATGGATIDARITFDIQSRRDARWFYKTVLRARKARALISTRSPVPLIPRNKSTLSPFLHNTYEVDLGTTQALADEVVFDFHTHPIGPSDYSQKMIRREDGTWGPMYDFQRGPSGGQSPAGYWFGDIGVLRQEGSPGGIIRDPVGLIFYDQNGKTAFR